MILNLQVGRYSLEKTHLCSLWRELGDLTGNWKNHLEDDSLIRFASCSGLPSALCLGSKSEHRKTARWVVFHFIMWPWKSHNILQPEAQTWLDTSGMQQGPLPIGRVYHIFVEIAHGMRELAFGSPGKWVLPHRSSWGFLIVAILFGFQINKADKNFKQIDWRYLNRDIFRKLDLSKNISNVFNHSLKMPQCYL